MDVNPQTAPRGEASGGRWSSVSSGLTPRRWLYLRQSSGGRLAVGSVVVCSVLTVAALAGGAALRSQGGTTGLLGIGLIVVGVLAGLIGLVMALLGIVSYRAELTLFRDGPLIPGVIVSTQPTVVVVLAGMGSSIPNVAHALAQITPGTVGVHDRKQGTRVPCFTRFPQDFEADSMKSVHIHLISWGTTDPAEVQGCIDRLGEEPFRRLEACVERGPLPASDMEKVLLDEEFEPVGAFTNA